MVCGLRSEAIQKMLLTEASLSLEKAIEISTSMQIDVREAQHFSASTQLHTVSVLGEHKSIAQQPKPLPLVYNCKHPASLGRG